MGEDNQRRFSAAPILLLVTSERLIALHCATHIIISVLSSEIRMSNDVKENLLDNGKRSSNS